MKLRRDVILIAMVLIFTCSFNAFGKSVNEFIPRNSAPGLNETYYCQPNNLFSNGNGVGNCTWYAYGRAYEILGKKPVFNGNAKQWWQFKDSYKGNGDVNSPRVGSIAVWGSNNDYGHVAVVEKVYEDGSVDLSESSWGGVWHNNYQYWGKKTYSKYGILNYPDGNGKVMGFLGYIYLLDENNVKGWVQSDGRWKYANGDGTYIIGWLLEGGKWYYFNNAGFMETGWIQVEGLWYYMAADGSMTTGWSEINGKWYYFYEIGEMATGWISIDGNDYFLGNDGVMYKNVRVEIDGTTYDIDNNGVAVEHYEKTELPAKPETPKVPESEGVGNHILYSYRTREVIREYTTSDDPNLEGWELLETIDNENWGSWSDWSTNYIESSAEIEVETRKVSVGDERQIYLGRYYSSSKNNFSPNKLDSSYSFEGGWFNEDDVSFVGQAFAGGRSDCYTVSGYHYYFFEIGDHGGETRTISTGEETEYRYREKVENSTYKYYRDKYTSWGAWSDWSNTPVEESDVVEVKTRTV